MTQNNTQKTPQWPENEWLQINYYPLKHGDQWKASFGEYNGNGDSEFVYGNSLEQAITSALKVLNDKTN